MDRREYALYFVSRELDYSEQYYKFKNVTIEYLRNPSIKAQKELYSVTLKSIIPFYQALGHMDIYFMFQKMMNKKKLKRILMIIFHYMENLKEK